MDPRRETASAATACPAASRESACGSAVAVRARCKWSRTCWSTTAYPLEARYGMGRCTTMHRANTVHMPPAHRAYTMHMSCTNHAATAVLPCICRAYAVHAACICRAHPMHLPCIHHAGHRLCVLDPAYTTLAACVGEHTTLAHYPRTPRVHLEQQPQGYGVAARQAYRYNLDYISLQPRLHVLVTGEHRALGHLRWQPQAYRAAAWHACGSTLGHRVAAELTELTCGYSLDDIPLQASTGP